MTIVINPKFWAFVFVGTMGLYLLNVAIFHEIHLRRKKERVAWSVLLVYYVRVQPLSSRFPCIDLDTRQRTR